MSLFLKSARSSDRMQEQIKANYDRIKAEVVQIIGGELARIENGPEWAHLLKGEERSQKQPV